MNLLNLPPGEATEALAGWLTTRGEPRYRLRQLAPRLWRRPVAAWNEVSDVPRSLAAALELEFPLPRLRVVRRQVSRDGTVKLLWRLPDGAAIESVWIPEGRRRTLCISSQVGCAFGCVFCATGRMGFQRHLAPWEIAAQVRESMLQEPPLKPSNVVFMGMGEPLHNWDAVDVALTILNHPTGVGIGARHITVSTVGLLPGLAKLAARPEQFRLAVSLHAGTSARRREIMPVERKYPVDHLVQSLQQFRRRVTLEYVLMAGVNDTPGQIEALGRLALSVGALVNLLPLHPGGAPHLQPTDVHEIRHIAQTLRARGVPVSVRRSRGLDISAACGQLRVESEQVGEISADQHAGVEQ